MQINSNFNLPPRNVDPDTYAKQYASENNISLDKAREELRSKFGDPQAPDESVSTVNNIPSVSSDSMDLDEFEGLDDKVDSKSSVLESLRTLLSMLTGKTEKAKRPDKSKEKQDPDAYAQQYANEHNISLEEAKAELKKQHGDPNKEQ